MNKVVLITGASSGMGKETAKLLVQNGYKVYAAARRIQLMGDLQQLGCKIIEMDVSQEDAMVNGINSILAEEGKIDILINNAGFGSYGAIEDVDLKDARYQLEVNLFGAARLIQLVIPAMRKQKSGKIVNISSIGGKFATPLGGWYHASKFAMEGLSDSLRNELKTFGIDVIVIEPGGVQTEWADIAMDNLIKASKDRPYEKLANQFAALSKKGGGKAALPIDIARLIQKAIVSKKPKTRYSGGYGASLLLFLNKVLSDRMLDKVLNSQFK
ncbi:oxidoreductase [Pedobacter sp. L105]|uniref:oxidoreductase n=1 Tax=Pedobacter sp. L105 TaxID=1641871 RepID=UPI00131D264A|nr:oxidoreductase [Pedobacter sp. L105]